MLKYFKLSLVFTAIALVLAGIVGYMYGSVNGAISYVISVFILGILETSVSLDNAVVIAVKLETMSDLWKQRFLTWGMAIAVFGMRLVFPLLIVSVAGHVNPIDAVNIALTEPDEYEKIITSVHTEIMAFGATFLFLVFSRHFINAEKDSHWIPGLGNLLANLGKHSTASLFIPMVTIFAISTYVPDQLKFIMASLAGLITYLIVDGLGDILDGDEESSGDLVVSVAKGGLGAFIYLEVLDASFSFDGVIAAFAITNNFIIIMLGLGIGAMFVRSMTLLMVDKGTLGELKYLEDGAFWGIGWLVIAMFLSVFHIELGEIVVAGGAALLIGLSAIHSIINKDTE